MKTVVEPDKDLRRSGNVLQMEGGLFSSGWNRAANDDDNEVKSVYNVPTTKIHRLCLRVGFSPLYGYTHVF